MGSGISTKSDKELSSLIKHQYKKDPQKTSRIIHNCYQQVVELDKGFTPPNIPTVNSKFSEMDVNGNGLISLAEIDKLIATMYPKFDNKPALIRAYHAADTNGNGLISKKEFKSLWEYIEYFNRVWHKFEAMDKNNDRKLNLDEFKTMSCELFDTKFKDKEAAYVFELIDTNNGGAITFTEFCSFMIKRKMALE